MRFLCIPSQTILRRLSRGGQETAAQRRRRLAEQDAHEPTSALSRALHAAQDRRQEASDSEDDGTERVPPNSRLTRQRSNSLKQVRSNLAYQDETAAERRRREGALGVSKDDSSDEDETKPAQYQEGAWPAFSLVRPNEHSLCGPNIA